MNDYKNDSLVRHVAILGNVCVGKTCLFDRLTLGGEHSVNIPGSTLKVSRGMLALGSGGASRGMRHRCASCSRRGLRKSARGTGLCCTRPNGSASADEFFSECPALKGKAPGRASSRPLIPLITHLYDTPGSATLAANSEDEIVARNLVLSGRADEVVIVADAKNLRRSLALALEVAELGLPMVFDLNMIDEAENMGIEIDDEALAAELGVPVARTVATERIGLRRLAEMILEAKVPNRPTRFPEAVEKALKELAELLDNPILNARALGLLLMANDLGAKSWVAEQLGSGPMEQAEAIIKKVQSSLATPLKTLIADLYYAKAEQIVDRVVVAKASSPSLLVRFGAMAQKPLSGTIIGLCVLILAYYWVGAFGATFLVDTINNNIFDGFLLPLITKLVEPIPSEFVRDAIVDPNFGLVPTGLFLALGIVLPVLFCFYLLQAVLEDSGYLPRLAILFDRLFRKIGLNGQGLIPLILGFSCVTMALITTRMLPTRKERVILSLMLILGIPCAPLFAVMVVILGKMPWTAAALVFVVIATQVVLGGYLASRLIPGRRSALILEIPKMRIPRPRILWSITWRRTWLFMKEAVPIFLAASFVVFLFDRIGGLEVVATLVRPVVHGLLGLPDQAIQVFIKTVIRRENGAAELVLLRDHFSNVQLIVTMLVMVFLIPCINSVIVLVKERGLKTSAAIIGTVLLWAVTIGTIINFVTHALGVTFT